jgi:hypothetical protein
VFQAVERKQYFIQELTHSSRCGDDIPDIFSDYRKPAERDGCINPVASMSIDGEKETKKRACPDCQSTAVGRSRRHGAIESLLRILRIVPFRCEECGKRFFGWVRKAGHQV